MANNTAEIAVKPLCNEGAVNSWVFNLTNRCNTVCRYCFQESRADAEDHVKITDLARVLDFLVKRAGDRPKYLQLTGGEIFVREDIFDIIELALSLGCIVRVQTNGLTFSETPEKELKCLSSDKLLIKISVDGWDEKTHELYRAKGSFQKVVAGIEAVRKFNRNIAIKTVIHEGNLPEIWRMLDFCMKMGARGLSYNLQRREGRSRELPIYRITELDVVRALVPWFKKPVYSHLLNGSDILRYCLAPCPVLVLGKIFFIDYDGGIFPNQNCEPAQRIGNIFSENLDEQFVEEKLTERIQQVDGSVFDFVKSTLKIRKE